MLVVKLEIWPYGSEGDASQIGEVRIWNVGGNSAVGRYEGSVELDGEKQSLPPRAAFARELGPWVLLTEMLQEHFRLRPYSVKL